MCDHKYARTPFKIQVDSICRRKYRIEYDQSQSVGTGRINDLSGCFALRIKTPKPFILNLEKSDSESYFRI